MADGDDGTIDRAAIRARYRHEREKRLRPDGTDQYVHAAGELAHYVDDPHAGLKSPRAPLTDEVDVVIVGGGIGGLLTAAHLRGAGVTNVRIIDKADDFGGTWYWNRYPGAACDIESYIYLPMLEEVGYLPREKYARQPEIFAYLKTLAVHFGLYANACFQTLVTGLAWADDTARWTVTTDRGDAIKARFVCLANGNPLHRLKLPGVPGIERFKGHAFHTSRWDYAYTGGDERGGLTGLADKRVGLIGTGATAVQVVPELGRSAGHLDVFQRTPSSIDVRNNRSTDPSWGSALQPGWQRRRRKNFTALLTGGLEDEDLVGDGWTEGYWRTLQSRTTDAAVELAALLDRSDDIKMAEIRSRVDAIVADPATADALKPWYRRLCKRPCFHDDYLATFNRPNVTLVDTQGRGVERITERGVVVGGREYPLDCLIYATGFEFGTGFAERLGFPVVGIDRVTLAKKWREGAATLHGMLSRGFPNCLILSMVQAGATANVTHMLDEQARHAAYLIRTALDRGLQAVQPTAEAEAAWVADIVRLAASRLETLADCTPGYLNNEGRPQAMSLKNSFYAGGALRFIEILTGWRAEGRLAGLECENRKGFHAE